MMYLGFYFCPHSSALPTGRFLRKTFYYKAGGRILPCDKGKSSNLDTRNGVVTILGTVIANSHAIHSIKNEAEWKKPAGGSTAISSSCISNCHSGFETQSNYVNLLLKIFRHFGGSQSPWSMEPGALLCRLLSSTFLQPVVTSGFLPAGLCTCCLRCQVGASPLISCPLPLSIQNSAEASLGQYRALTLSHPFSPPSPCCG
ncbi:uncharacterized protein LOC109118366 [Fukomys damarensis]|uniref:uncharacterized protein LOC109118366 n=1 Tax=Fukomys damarensis TaxID=885580 RepID=UPI001455D11B|nr:uncharacterized protein LOC109118366 [Fukomys damarensis]